MCASCWRRGQAGLTPPQWSHYLIQPHIPVLVNNNNSTIQTKCWKQKHDKKHKTPFLRGRHVLYASKATEATKCSKPVSPRENYFLASYCKQTTVWFFGGIWHKYHSPLRGSWYHRQFWNITRCSFAQKRPSPDRWRHSGGIWGFINSLARLGCMDSNWKADIFWPECTSW